MSRTWQVGSARRTLLGSRMTWRRWIALVAAIGQVALFVASSTESWRDASAHVERGGTRLHYAHDEASCVACAARNLHARPLLRLPDLAVVVMSGEASLEQSLGLPKEPDYNPYGSRAPPAV